MNDINPKTKVLIGRIFGLLGYIFCIIIPYISIILFILGIVFSYTREEQDITHNLAFNIIGLIISLLFIIISFI